MKGSYKEEDVDLFYIAPEGRIRTNEWKLYSERSKLEIRRNFLFHESR